MFLINVTCLFLKFLEFKSSRITFVKREKRYSMKINMSGKPHYSKLKVWIWV